MNQKDLMDQQKKHQLRVGMTLVKQMSRVVLYIKDIFIQQLLLLRMKELKNIVLIVMKKQEEDLMLVLNSLNQLQIIWGYHMKMMEKEKLNII